MEAEVIPEGILKSFREFKFNIPGKGVLDYSLWKITREKYHFVPNLPSTEDHFVVRHCKTREDLFKKTGTNNCITITTALFETLVADGTLQEKRREPAVTQLMPPTRLLSQPQAEIGIEKGVKEAEEAISALERLVAQTYDLVTMAKFQPMITRLISVRTHIGSSLYIRLVSINARLTILHNEAPEKKREDLQKAIKTLNALLSTLTN